MILSFRIELTLQQASCGIVSRQLENINNAATYAPDMHVEPSFPDNICLLGAERPSAVQ